MAEEAHISNAHIVWFVVKYELDGDRLTLTPDFSRMVTLENSVVAVTAAQAIPQPEFEETLKAKLQKVMAGQ